MEGNSRQSWILDSTPWIPDSSYWIPDSLSVEAGFYKIPIVNGIPNSLSCILVSKAQYIVYSKKKKFPGFWILQTKISLLPESGFSVLTKGEKILGLEIPRDADPIYWSYIFPVFRKEVKYPFKMSLVHVKQGAVCKNYSNRKKSITLKQKRLIKNVSGRGN